MKRFLRQHLVLVVCGILFVACVIGIIAINKPVGENPSPQRVAPISIPSDSSTSKEEHPPSASPTPEVVEVLPTKVAIPASDIVSVSVASIGLDVAVSGETWPRKTQNCKGDKYCIDPPVADQAAWYGDPPSYPSENPVLLFGHTSWTDPAYATFNDLPAMLEGDLIVVTTETGVFTYRAEAPTIVPYSEATQSETIFGWELEKLVMVTCNNAESGATVIVGHLVESAPSP